MANQNAPKRQSRTSASPKIPVGVKEAPPALPQFSDHLKEYARQRPEVVAFWCFGIGFIVGWKLKPW